MEKLLLVFALVLGVSADGFAKSIACNACTYEQREAAAIGQGTGARYVHDLRFGAIHKFIVEREPAPGGRFTYSALEYSVETDLVDSFGKLKALYDANGGSLAVNLNGDLPAQSAGSAGRSLSAYDAVDPGAYQNAVADYLAADWYSGLTSGSYQIIYGAIYAFRIMDFANGPQLTFEVEFPDGSKMVFKFELATKKWVYVKGSARDSNGNNIPDSRADVVRVSEGTQRYLFDGPNGDQNRERAMERFQQLGIPMAGGRVWACVQTPATGVTCRVVR
ncbi:MAG TPA: hypothetical protein VM555_00815 [Tahibacter sp.]|nr:hypothetical protein [Tahibacter sp.]